MAGPISPAWQRFGGMHCIDANPAAVAGYKSGKHPDGSVIVSDNHEVTVFQGAEIPTKRRFVDVMEKAGGAWRFSAFNEDSKTRRNVTVTQGEQQCAACHSQASTDHVDSQFRP